MALHRHVTLPAIVGYLKLQRVWLKRAPLPKPKRSRAPLGRREPLLAEWRHRDRTRFHRVRQNALRISTHRWWRLVRAPHGRDAFGRAFDHEVETVEGALPRGKNAMRVLREVLRFPLVRSSTEVQGPFEPDPHRGVTCGRPSGRTVESQYTSALASSSRACDHSVGVALALLKALSSVTGTGSAIALSDLLRRASKYRCWIDRKDHPRICTRSVCRCLHGESIRNCPRIFNAMVTDTSSLAGHQFDAWDSAQCSFRARVSSALLVTEPGPGSPSYGCRLRGQPHRYGSVLRSRRCERAHSRSAASLSRGSGPCLQGGGKAGRQGAWHGAQAPDELRAGVEANLKSLGLEQVPVVNLRRHPDSDVPFDEQVDAMVELRREGRIGAFGLSNVTPEEYSKARAKSDIACVQKRLQHRRP